MCQRYASTHKIMICNLKEEIFFEQNNQEFHENWIKSQNKAEILRQDSNNAPQISIWPVILQTYGLRYYFIHKNISLFYIQYYKMCSFSFF